MQLKIYVDGVLQDTVAYKDPVSFGFDKTLFIGDTFKGSIEEVAFYQRALTASKIMVRSKIIRNDIITDLKLDSNTNPEPDTSGNNNPGTLLNATFTSTGLTGGAYTFNALDGVDDYIQIVDNPDFNVPVVQPLTLECFVKVNSNLNSTGDGFQLCLKQSDGVQAFALGIGPDLKARLDLRGTGNNGNWNTVVGKKDIVTDGRWHHLVGVKTEASSNPGLSEMRIYVDGVLEGSETASVGDINPNAPLVIGNRLAGKRQPLQLNP